MMVREVNELRKKIAEALNGSRLPPVVAALVLDSYRAELQRLVEMQEAAEAARPQEKEDAEDGTVQSK